MKKKIRKSHKTFCRKGYSFEPSNSVAVCIGVEDYLHLPTVSGACESASTVFDALTKSNTGICNSAKSRLLLNPTYGEFHRFLESYTYFLKPEDHVFFYFCGRTEFVNNKSVLCLRDSTILSNGLINPFTVQGWQAFFQLAGVSHVRSVVFACDTRETSPDHQKGKKFIRSIKKSIEGGLPMPQDIIWGIMAGHYRTERSGESHSATGHMYAKHMCDVLMSPPRHTVSDPFIPFSLFSKAFRTRQKQAILSNSFNWLARQSIHGNIAICRNPVVKARTERFFPYYINILRAFMNMPAGDHNPHEVLSGISPAAWTVVNKLSYAPWRLIAEGSQKGTKKITLRGKRFLRGKIGIPLVITKSTDEWEASGKELVDIKYFEGKELQKKMEQEDIKRQMELLI